MTAAAVNVCFRVDASATIGGGHVMRCLTLAKHLNKEGWDCTFVVSRETAQTVSALRESGFPVLEVASATGAEIAGLGRFDIVIFDQYEIDATEEHRWRQISGSIVVIDDLGDREHDCDMLLDQNFGATREKYVGLVPVTCRTLVGSKYALLREEFSRLRASSLARRDAAVPGPASRILVTMGMTDVGGITERICRHLIKFMDLTHYLGNVDVVLGTASQSFSFVSSLCERDSRFSIHVNVSNISELMSACDASIGAGGTTSWERCALGLPMANIVLADNQVDLCRQLSDSGACAYLGDSRTDSDAVIGSRIDAFLQGHETLVSYSRIARDIVDGEGVKRVFSELQTLFQNQENAPASARSGT